MATEYLVQGSLLLEPRMIKTIPHVTVSWPGHAESMDLAHERSIAFSFCALKHGWLEIDFNNKNYQETGQDQDMAVLIRRIEFFGISDPRFVWQGIYKPEYPQPWFGQQIIPPAAQLSPHDYLGWNGRWRLDFDLPVFVWMHRVLALGWIYR